MEQTQKTGMNSPEHIFEEYRQGVTYKNGLGEKGLYRQCEINERFFAGDQWHGAVCGTDRPLVRHNVIRRVGEYKMAAVGAQGLAVNFSADGLSDTTWTRDRTREWRRLAAQGCLSALSQTENTDLMLSALSGYFRTTAERVGLDSLREQVLKNAYCTGTGVLYTYWDDTVPTGLFADEGRTVPLKGDIACEVLNIEQVYFGDPTVENIQSQPYILIAARRSVKELRRLAKKAGQKSEDIARICPDRDGRPPMGEPEEAGKALMLTKFYKEQRENGEWTVKGVQVCRGVTIRNEWDLGIRLYPVSVFRWETRPCCAYGDSEITWMIPNQIAINRMLTASVWSTLIQGMPTLLVNGDIIDTPVSNDPGQVIRVFGGSEELRSAMQYVDPPHVSAAIDSTVNTLIADTLSQNGATAAALGDVNPNNTSAIVAVREAALMPLQMVRNRFHAFYEDVARVWAEFWVMAYGTRPLRVEDEWGCWYLPFNGDDYRQLVIRARVDVGAANLWSEGQSILTLDNLLAAGVLTPEQYLKRLPKGTVPDVDGLLRELRTEKAVMV